MGEGTWGTVFKSTRRVDGLIVAVKKIKAKETDRGLDFTALRELKYLRILNHSNIIQVIAIFTTICLSVFKKLFDCYIAEGFLHLVFEYCSYSLDKVYPDGFQIVMMCN